MSHLDDDDVSLLALGERPSALEEQHLAGCPQCRRRVEQLAATVAAARSVTDADRPVAPPSSVWAGIAAEVGLAAAAGPGPGAGTGPDPGPGGPSTVTPIAAARRSRSSWLVAVAAGFVGLAVGALVTYGAVSARPGTQLVASAELDPVGTYRLAGTATVEREDGTAVLTVGVPELPAVPGAYYEVWMASADTTTMVAVGTLNPGGRSTYPLPAGMDLSSYPVVDVSLEYFDGDPGHSATSVVRGLLEA